MAESRAPIHPAACPETLYCMHLQSSLKHHSNSKQNLRQHSNRSETSEPRPKSLESTSARHPSFPIRLGTTAAWPGPAGAVFREDAQQRRALPLPDRTRIDTTTKQNRQCSRSLNVRRPPSKSMKKVKIKNHKKVNANGSAT